MKYEWLDFDDNLWVDREGEFVAFLELLETHTDVSVFVIEETTKGIGKSWLASKIYQHLQKGKNIRPTYYVDYRRDSPNQDNLQGYVDAIIEIRNALQKFGRFDRFDQCRAVYANRRRAIEPLFDKLVDMVVTEAQLMEFAPVLGEPYEDIVVDHRARIRSKLYTLLEFAADTGKVGDLIDAIPVVVEGYTGGTDYFWEGLDHLRNEGNVRNGDSTTGSEPLHTEYGEISTIINRLGAVERDRAHKELNDTFFADLRTLADERGTVVLVFDGYEKAPGEIKIWLQEELLHRLDRGEVPQLMVLLCGRQTPYLDEDELELITITGPGKLMPFSEKHISELLQKRGIPREEIEKLDLPTIRVWTDGVPGNIAHEVDRLLAKTKHRQAPKH
jgi:hypothetical protein